MSFLSECVPKCGDIYQTYSSRIKSKNLPIQTNATKDEHTIRKKGRGISSRYGKMDVSGYNILATLVCSAVGVRNLLLVWMIANPYL